MDNNQNVINNRPENFNQQVPNNQNSLFNDNSQIFNNQPNDNQFVNNNFSNNTKLFDLNVNGEYNKLNKDEYARNVVNPQIVAPKKKKATIKITKEAKVFILIIIVMLVFIAFMPDIFELVEKIKFR